jgi:uncharacterized protein YkwD
MNRRFTFVLGLLGLAVGCGSGTEGASAAPAQDGSAQILASPRLDSGGHPLVSPSADLHVQAFETELIRLVNVYRVSKGLSALQDEAEIRDVARAHSEHMIVHGFFGHSSPEGLSPADRLDEAGVAWSGVGENLAAGYGSPQAVFDAWLLSPEHRQNIESETWTHTGVGYALDSVSPDSGSPLHYWTQTFLRP